ncbi:MAG: ABC transporter ATP-binding protein [Candidatus Competibacteraceae bacterium]
MIRLQHIRRLFQVGDQAVHALQAIDLTIATGEYVVIMGPSGSGKSTLLNVIGLLDRPDSGHYALDGEDMTAQDDETLARLRREKIGFVFQAFHLIPRLTAFENVELPLTLAGIAMAERRERVTQALTALGLADRAHHRPDQLSGGQRQRVAIARAMIMQPILLLADEPTGNLDRAAGREVLTILEKLNRDGITLLIVSHDPDIGERARRRLHLVDGRIESDVRRLPDDATD